MDTLKHLEIEKEKRDSLDKYGIIDNMTYVSAREKVGGGCLLIVVFLHQGTLGGHLLSEKENGIVERKVSVTIGMLQ